MHSMTGVFMILNEKKGNESLGQLRNRRVKKMKIMEECKRESEAL